MAGNKAAERVSPTAEDAPWRENYKKTPGLQDDYTGDDYAPAYSACERAQAAQRVRAQQGFLPPELGRSQGRDA
jgi:hypothetical protein